MMKKHKKLILLGLFFLVLAFIVKGEVSKLVVKVEMPESYKKVLAGEEIMVETEILLLREEDGEIIDVTIEYTITDENETVINRVTETKGGILRIHDVKYLLISEKIEPKVYTVKVKASYKGLVGMDTVDFEVIKEKEIEPLPRGEKEHYSVIVILLIVIIFIFIILLCYLCRKFKRIERSIRGISEKDLKDKGFI